MKSVTLSLTLIDDDDALDIIMRAQLSENKKESLVVELKTFYNENFSRYNMQLLMKEGYDELIADSVSRWGDSVQFTGLRRVGNVLKTTSEVFSAETPAKLTKKEG